MNRFSPIQGKMLKKDQELIQLKLRIFSYREQDSLNKDRGS